MREMDENKKRILRELINRLHDGVSPQKVKEEFKQFLDDVSPVEIAQIEQRLVEEGMSREVIQELCDVHLAVFREQLEKQNVDVPLGHPIRILLEEHRIMLQLAEKLGTVADKVRQVSDMSYVGDEIQNLEHIAKDFRDSEKHYLREENVLFPYIEKHGITEPPAIMWMEHNQIRPKKKQLYTLIEEYNTVGFQDFKVRLSEIVESLSEFLSSHFFKENNILFPTALRVIAEDEWKKIKREFDEIGYCSFTPSQVIGLLKVEGVKEEEVEEAVKTGEMIQFETGSLSEVEVEAVLNSLPIDISFVDKDDRLKYFNKAEERVFVRTKAVIGRKVQLCHPQKSYHVVNDIVESFKSGKKDEAEFWINVKDRLILIRYFAVRDKDGKYLGTVEVTQDISDIKEIMGEKRLLDWEAS